MIVAVMRIIPRKNLRRKRIKKSLVVAVEQIKRKNQKKPNEIPLVIIRIIQIF